MIHINILKSIIRIKMINKISAIVALLGTILFYFIYETKNDLFNTVIALFSIFGILFIITSFVLFHTTKLGENVMRIIKNRFKEIEEQKRYDDKLKLYVDSKHQLQYLSKDSLLQLYEDYKIQGKEDMKRLALEEILVEKGIIDYSPMHEKLNKISNRFFN
jgi:hypothetical protein